MRHDSFVNLTFTRIFENITNFKVFFLILFKICARWTCILYENEIDIWLTFPLYSQETVLLQLINETYNHKTYNSFSLAWFFECASVLCSCKWALKNSSPQSQKFKLKSNSNFSPVSCTIKKPTACVQK